MSVITVITVPKTRENQLKAVVDRDIVTETSGITNGFRNSEKSGESLFGLFLFSPSSDKVYDIISTNRHRVPVKNWTGPKHMKSIRRLT